MNLTDAQIIGGGVIAKLLPYCDRIEIAGSVRRQKLDVHDIELVAIPTMKPTFNMFGEQVGEHSLLNDRALFEQLGTITKNGPRFVQIDLIQGIMLDLFIVTPPAQWGVIYLIRTGPAEFSHWIVTPRSKGGALHNGSKCKDGYIEDFDGTIYDFDDEADFLNWLGLGWIEPSKREPQWGKFGRDYRA